MIRLDRIFLELGRECSSGVARGQGSAFPQPEVDSAIYQNAKRVKETHSHVDRRGAIRNA